MAWMILTAALLGQATAPPQVEGVWNASYKSSEGRTHACTLTLAVTGRSVSGTISSPRGSVDIERGAIDGRHISFAVIRRASYDEIAIVYEGTVDGDRMELRMQVDGREPLTITARREAPAAHPRNGTIRR